jgi:hypothetical protein
MKVLTMTEYVLWSIAGILGILLFVTLQPRVTPLSSVPLTIGQEDAARIAVACLAKQGFKTNELDTLARSVRFFPSQTQGSDNGL